MGVILYLSPRKWEVIRMTVAERVKELIRDDGLKQYAVAKKSGIPEKQFNALLNGRKTFTADLLVPICKAINRSPDEVLGFKAKREEDNLEKNKII